MSIRRIRTQRGLGQDEMPLWYLEMYQPGGLTEEQRARVVTPIVGPTTGPGINEGSIIGRDVAPILSPSVPVISVGSGDGAGGGGSLGMDITQINYPSTGRKVTLSQLTAGYQAIANPPFVALDPSNLDFWSRGTQINDSLARQRDTNRSYYDAAVAYGLVPGSEINPLYWEPKYIPYVVDVVSSGPVAVSPMLAEPPIAIPYYPSPEPSAVVSPPSVSAGTIQAQQQAIPTVPKVVVTPSTGAGEGTMKTTNAINGQGIVADYYSASATLARAISNIPGWVLIAVPAGILLLMSLGGRRR